MSRFARLIPVLLLSAMLSIALVIETYLEGIPHLLPKLPLIVLLVWPWMRSDGSDAAEIDVAGGPAFGEGTP